MVSNTTHYLTTDVKIRAMTWLMTRDSVTQPVAPFELRWMTSDGDAESEGLEVSPAVRDNFSFAASSTSGSPRSKYNSDITTAAFPTTHISGFEYWDTSATPKRIAWYSQGFGFDVTSGDFITVQHSPVGLQLAMGALATNALTNNAANRMNDWITGRSPSRPATAPGGGPNGFIIKLVRSTSSSASSNGDEFGSGSGEDLYTQVEGIDFTVTETGGVITAANSSEINFGAISSTGGRIVKSWEIWDTAGLRVAFGDFQGFGFVVFPNSEVKIKTGDLKLVLM